MRVSLFMSSGNSLMMFCKNNVLMTPPLDPHRMCYISEICADTRPWHYLYNWSFYCISRNAIYFRHYDSLPLGISAY